jgi:hypothetical protein
VPDAATGLVPLAVGSDEAKADGALSAVAAEFEVRGGVVWQGLDGGDLVSGDVGVPQDYFSIVDDESFGEAGFQVPELYVIFLLFWNMLLFR